VAVRQPAVGLVHHPIVACNMLAQNIWRVSGKAWGASEHEPAGKSVRQCMLRKLPEKR
jgi:hypothetical protein